MGGSSSEDDALPTGAGGASSGGSGSESEGGSGSDSSVDSGPAAPCPTCPDCGESFAQEGAVLKCRCGVERQASTVTPALRTPQPRAGKPPSGKRRVSKTPPKVTRSQKFQLEVSSRLSLGVPSFVLKDASTLYNKALKADRPKGCSDIGLALAALEHALHKHKLEPPRPELCTAAQSKVNLVQLEACSAVLRKVSSERFPDQTPNAAHFASKLCEDLLEPQKMRERGAWAKAAEAVANQAEELRAGLDSPPLVLAAAICILVFERHTPKEKITTQKVAKTAGQAHDQVTECSV